MDNDAGNALTSLCDSADQDDAIEVIKKYLRNNSDAASYEYAWRCAQNYAQMKEFTPYKLCILSSFTTSLLDAYLSTAFFLEGYLLEVKFVEFGQWHMEMMRPGQIDEFKPNSVILLLQVEDVLPNLANAHLSKAVALRQEEEEFLNNIRTMLEQFRARSNIPVGISNFVSQMRSVERYFDWNTSEPKQYLIDQLNVNLSKLVLDYGNVSIYDYSGLVCDFGRNNFFNRSNYFQNANLIAHKAYSLLSLDIVQYLCAAQGNRKKALVVDLDDTIWGGIVGEDGPYRVKTSGEYPGNGFSSFQTFLINLRASGIVLAISSKNNESDVNECFAVREKDLVLTLDNFSVCEINWEDKSANLRKIASELNISMDSIVFCDDSPVECDLVRNNCPEVTVIQLKGNPGMFHDEIIKSGVFDAVSVTRDDIVRADFYTSETQRRIYAKSVKDTNTYLQSLEMELTVSKPKNTQLERVIQLFSRTNQFNLTNQRYQYEDIIAFGNQGKDIMLFELSDRYGSYGVISVFVKSTIDSTSTIDALIVSCRALGRGVENAILAVIEEGSRKAGAKQLVGLFKESKKNAVASTFYNNNGFYSTDVVGKYVRDLTKSSKLQAPSYIKICYSDA
jgi:FkbH-like protein